MFTQHSYSKHTHREQSTSRGSVELFSACLTTRASCLQEEKRKMELLSPDTPPPAPCPPSYGSINSFYKRLLHSLSTLCNIQGRQTQLRLFWEEEGRSEKTLKDSMMKTAVMNRDTCSHLLKLGSLIVLLIFMSNRKSQVPNVNTYVNLHSSHCGFYVSP